MATFEFAGSRHNPRLVVVPVPPDGAEIEPELLSSVCTLASPSSADWGDPGDAAEGVSDSTRDSRRLDFDVNVREVLATLAAAGDDVADALPLFDALFSRRGVGARPADAAPFQWDPALVAACDQMFVDCGYSIERLAARLHASSEGSGLTEAAILHFRALDPDGATDPDYDRALKIAREGVSIRTAKGYVIPSERKKLRWRYLSNLLAINQGFEERCRIGEMIILSDHLVQRAIRAGETVGAAAVHAADKNGIQNARPIWDAEHGFNADEVVAAGEIEWGVLRHPTADDTIRTLNAARTFYTRKRGKRAKIVINSVDIKGAFQFIKVNDQYVGCTGQVASDDMWLFYLYGFFGWCLFPLVWGVMTRLMLKIMQMLGVSFIIAYCDDFTAFTTEERAAEELATMIFVAETLLGKSAVNLAKIIRGVTAASVQGWWYDTEGLSHVPSEEESTAGTVEMSPVNLEKFLFQLLTFRRDGKALRSDLESIFSRSHRASRIFRELRPFIRAFSNSTRGLKRNVLKSVEPDVVLAVHIWRVFLARAFLFPDRFRRALDSFDPGAPCVKVSFDACLSGMSVTMQFLDAMGYEGAVFCMKVVKFDPARFEFARTQDPSFQNTVEYLCPVLAVLLLATLGFRGIWFVVEGDSVSGLTWATTGKTQMGPSLRGVVTFTEACLRSGIRPHPSFMFIRGVDNYYNDLRSRDGNNGKDPPVRLADFFSDLTLAASFEAGFLDVVDPEAPLSVASISPFLDSVHGLIDSCMREGASTVPPLADDASFDCIEFFAKGGTRVSDSGEVSAGPPWRFSVSRAAKIQDLFDAFLEHFLGLRVGQFGVYCMRIHRRFYLDDGHKLVAEVGLLSMDTLELFCLGRGGAPVRGSGDGDAVGPVDGSDVDRGSAADATSADPGDEDDLVTVARGAFLVDVPKDDEVPGVVPALFECRTCSALQYRHSVHPVLGQFKCIICGARGSTFHGKVDPHLTLEDAQLPAPADIASTLRRLGGHAARNLSPLPGVSPVVGPSPPVQSRLPPAPPPVDPSFSHTDVVQSTVSEVIPVSFVCATCGLSQLRSWLPDNLGNFACLGENCKVRGRSFYGAIAPRFLFVAAQSGGSDAPAPVPCRNDVVAPTPNSPSASFRHEGVGPPLPRSGYPVVSDPTLADSAIAGVVPVLFACVACRELQWRSRLPDNLGNFACLGVNCRARGSFFYGTVAPRVVFAAAQLTRSGAPAPVSPPALPRHDAGNLTRRGRALSPRSGSPDGSSSDSHEQVAHRSKRRRARPPWLTYTALGGNGPLAAVRSRHPGVTGGVGGIELDEDSPFDVWAAVYASLLSEVVQPPCFPFLYVAPSLYMSRRPGAPSVRYGLFCSIILVRFDVIAYPVGRVISQEEVDIRIAAGTGSLIVWIRNTPVYIDTWVEAARLLDLFSYANDATGLVRITDGTPAVNNSILAPDEHALPRLEVNASFIRPTEEILWRYERDELGLPNVPLVETLPPVPALGEPWRPDHVLASSSPAVSIRHTPPPEQSDALASHSADPVSTLDSALASFHTTSTRSVSNVVGAPSQEPSIASGSSVPASSLADSDAPPSPPSSFLTTTESPLSETLRAAFRPAWGSGALRTLYAPMPRLFASREAWVSELDTIDARLSGAPGGNATVDFDSAAAWAYGHLLRTTWWITIERNRFVFDEDWFIFPVPVFFRSVEEVGSECARFSDFILAGRNQSRRKRRKAKDTIRSLRAQVVELRAGLDLVPNAGVVDAPAAGHLVSALQARVAEQQALLDEQSQTIATLVAPQTVEAPQVDLQSSWDKFEAALTFDAATQVDAPDRVSIGVATDPELVDSALLPAASDVPRFPRVRIPFGTGEYVLNRNGVDVITIGQSSSDVVRVSAPRFPGSLDPLLFPAGIVPDWSFLLRVEIRLSMSSRSDDYAGPNNRPSVFALLDSRMSLAAFWGSLEAEYPGVSRTWHGRMWLRVSRYVSIDVRGTGDGIAERVLPIRSRSEDSTLFNEGIRDGDVIELKGGGGGSPMYARDDDDDDAPSVAQDAKAAAALWASLHKRLALPVEGLPAAGVPAALSVTSASSSSLPVATGRSILCNDQSVAQPFRSALTAIDSVFPLRHDGAPDDPEVDVPPATVLREPAAESATSLVPRLPVGASFRAHPSKAAADSGLFTSEDYVDLDSLHGVGPGVQSAYDKSWDLWIRFLELRGSGGLYLLNATDIEPECARLLISLFAVYLGKPPHSKNAVQIGTVCSGVRNGFVKLGGDSMLWEAAMLRWAKRSHAVSGKESSASIDAHKKLAAPAEFYPYVRSILEDTLAGLMVYLAVVFIYLTGVRYCNVGHTAPQTNANTGARDLPNKHSLTRGEVFFESGGRRLNIPAFYEHAVATCDKNDVVGITAMVDAVVFKFESHKIAGKRSLVIFEVLPIEPSDLSEAALAEQVYVRELIEWILFKSGHGCEPEGSAVAGFEPNALVFSKIQTYVRQSGSHTHRAELQRDRASAAIKAAAVHFGFDPNKFSVYSVRHGAITDLTESRTCDTADIQRFAGHSIGSSATRKYQLFLDSGPRPALADPHFTVQSLKRVAEVTENPDTVVKR